MGLTEQQQAFFADNGYLSYGRVLEDAEVEGLRQRSEEIANGRVEHVPPRYVQLEAAFRCEEAGGDRLDQSAR